MIRGLVSDYIPNPTFDVVARPGAQEEYFRKGNPEGKSYRELVGEPMRAIPAFREPGPRLELMDELGVDRTLMFPTLASLLEERMRDDPELTHVAIHASQRVDVRDMVLQLRGPHLLDAGDHPSHRGKGDRGARVGASSAGRRRCSSARRRCQGMEGLARLPSRSSTRSGNGWSMPTSSCPCTLRTAVTPATR